MTWKILERTEYGTFWLNRKTKEKFYEYTMYVGCTTRGFTTRTNILERQVINLIIWYGDKGYVKPTGWAGLLGTLKNSNLIKAK